MRKPTRQEGHKGGRFARLIGFLAGFFLLSGCLGISVPGGPGGSTGATRELTGSIPAGQQAGLKSQAEEGGLSCAAETVIATDSTGETTMAEVAEDCSFSITLEIGKSYVISFALDGEFVATLIFSSGIDGFASSDLFVSDGTSPINLGTITITGDVAIPELEPEGQCDEDGDGEDDIEDADDDGDGVEDLEEEDCDLDGVEDDHDEENETCEEEEILPDMARVFEVKPRNDPHPELGEDRVDLDRDIRARIDCVVDPESVNTDSFRIEHDEELLECEYRVEEKDYGSRIECEHEGMHPNALYVTTIEGVLCLDGRLVSTKAWAWLTEPADEDEGDHEGDLEDEMEAEEEEEDDEGDGEMDDDGEDAEGSEED